VAGVGRDRARRGHGGRRDRVPRLLRAGSASRASPETSRSRASAVARPRGPGCTPAGTRVSSPPRS
jgi:hypothetical protein